MSIFDNTPQEQVTALYVSYFNRAPDPVGLGYWVGRLKDGMSLGAIADSFSVQPEAVAKYPYLTNPEVASPSTFLNSVYMNLFNRGIDPEGLAYWTAQLDAGRSVGEIILDIAGGAQGDDAVIVANKVAVGVDFAQQAADVQGFVYNDAAATAAAEVLDGVDATDASVVAGKAETVDFIAGAGNTGELLALTVGVDALVGTSGNDSITGVHSAPNSGSNTFSSGDAIDGGAGEDTLKIVSTANSAVFAKLTNVERVEVTAFNNNSNLNLSTSSGIKEIALIGGDAGLNVVGLTALVDVEISGEQAGGVNLQYTNAVTTGTETAQKLSLDGVNTSFSADGVETLSITVTGEVTADETNNISLGGVNDLTTLNIAGDGDLVLWDISTSLETLDASAATGDIAAYIQAGEDVTVTGGAGNDHFLFDSFNEDDVVNGGAGEDTLAVNGGNFTLAADAKAFNQLNSVERVAFFNTSTVLNGATFTNASITNLLFDTNDGGTDVINNAGSARTYEFGTSNDGNAEFRMNGTSTTLNIDLVGADGLDAVSEDGSDANVGDILVELSGTQPATAVATINLTSMGDIGNGENNVGVITAKAGSTVVIDGSANLDIDGFAFGTKIDASAFTGDLQIGGSQIVVGGNETGDVYTLGSGQDEVQVEVGGSGVLVAGKLVIDVINEFATGTDGDVLNLFGSNADYSKVAGSVQTAISALAGAGATLVAAADLAAGDGSTDWTAFSFQGQTYAIYDAVDGGAYDGATDVLVQLTGVIVADLTADNFA